MSSWFEAVHDMVDFVIFFVSGGESKAKKKREQKNDRAIKKVG